MNKEILLPGELDQNQLKTLTFFNQHNFIDRIYDFWAQKIPQSLSYARPLVAELTPEQLLNWQITNEMLKREFREVYVALGELAGPVNEYFAYAYLQVTNKKPGLDFIEIGSKHDLIQTITSKDPKIELKILPRRNTFQGKSIVWQGYPIASPDGLITQKFPGNSLVVTGIFESTISPYPRTIRQYWLMMEFFRTHPELLAQLGAEVLSTESVKIMDNSNFQFLLLIPQSMSRDREIAFIKRGWTVEKIPFNSYQMSYASAFIIRNYLLPE